MDIIPTVWLLLLLAIIFGLYKWGTRNYGAYQKINIPYVKPVPFLGNMGPFLQKKKAFADILNGIYNQFKGNGLIGFFRFVNPALMLCDPEIIKMITVKDFDHFTDHTGIVKEEDDPLFGKNMFSLTGERWRSMRHTLSPAFTSSKMKAMFLLLAECGEQMGRYLETTCKDAGGKLTLDMKDFFTRFTNDVIATAAFGIKCDSLQQPDNEFYMMGKEGTNFGAFRLMGFFISPLLMRLFKITFIRKPVYDFFLSLVTTTMARREKEHIIRPDMIHLLMEARKGTLKTDANDDDNDNNIAKSQHMVHSELTDEDITAQAFLFFIAGFDTASTNLCFLTHLLAVNPDIQQRVQKEIDTMYKDGGGKLTYDGVQNMKYTDMVISETLRLWPPAVATDRRCVKAYTIPASYSNPKFSLKVGDSILIPIQALHRDPEYFENPDKFDPERFSDENKHKIKPFTYLPFGVGPRVCIGQRFAVMETKIALACFLSRFDLEVVSKTQTKLVYAIQVLSTGIDGGFWLGIKPRSKF